ncbi:MAG: type III pantothenate kinase [Planctomycetota bacterium]|nr:type III pantothenate kinase [Planctomycetota bacterium]
MTSLPDGFHTVDIGNSTVGVGHWCEDKVTVKVFGEPAEAAASCHGPMAFVSVSTAGSDAFLAHLPPSAISSARALTQCCVPTVDSDLAETAGADRIALVTAVLPGPAVCVDLGTAVTVDLVSHEGVYQGGFIAPGPNIAAEGLSRGADSLPHVPPSAVPVKPGVTTVPAIESGVWGLMVGGVDYLVEIAKEQLGDPEPKIVSTGGWGASWAKASHHAGIEVNPHLIHYGIREWAIRTWEPIES